MFFFLPTDTSPLQKNLICIQGGKKESGKGEKEKGMAVSRTKKTCCGGANKSW